MKELDGIKIMIKQIDEIIGQKEKQNMKDSNEEEKQD